MRFWNRRQALAPSQVVDPAYLIGEEPIIANARGRMPGLCDYGNDPLSLPLIVRCLFIYLYHQASAKNPQKTKIIWIRGLVQRVVRSRLVMRLQHFRQLITRCPVAMMALGIARPV